MIGIFGEELIRSIYISGAIHIKTQFKLLNDNMEIDVTKIPLSNIESLIPRILYLKFLYFGILNVGSVMKIDRDEFKKLRGIGTKTLRQLDDFQYIIDKNPELIVSNHDENIEIFDILTHYKIDTIEIQYIRSIIPKRLYEIFKQLKITKINSVLKTKKETIFEGGSFSRTGLKIFEDFKELIKNNPDLIYSTYQKNKPKIIPFDNNLSIDKNLLSFLIKLVNDYFSVINTKDQKEIFFKRYGIGENKIYTLKEIGIYYGKTKERIRQIQKQHLSQIKILIDGNLIKKRNLKCSIDAIKHIAKLKKELYKYQIISSHQMHSIFKDEFSINVSRKSLSYLYLILDIFHVTECSFRDNIFYITDEGIKKSKFLKVCSTIFSLLRTNVVPTSQFDLIVNIKKRLKPDRIDNRMLELVCDFLPEIEELPPAPERRYQITCENLFSIGDFAYRILYEKNSRMHRREILREINHRLTTAAIQKKVTPEKLTAKMSNKKTIVPIGKSGYWVLKDWKENTKTLKNVIVDAFLSFNRPCTIKEIFEYLIKDRPEIKIESIYNYTNIYHDNFTKLRNNTIILKQWEKKHCGSRVKIVSDSFNNTLITIFSNESFGKLTTKQLNEQLLSHNVKMSSSGFAARLNKTLILKKQKVDNRCYYSLMENYEKIFDQIREKKPTLEIIKEKIVELIKNADTKELLLSEIVKTIIHKYNYSKGTIYRIIQIDKDFMKLEKAGGKTFVTLSEPSTKKAQNHNQ
jgi:hypothetical protein